VRPASNVQRLGQYTLGNGLPGVNAIERRGEIADKLRPVFAQSVANALENAGIDTLRVVRRFAENRRHRTQQDQRFNARVP
jgi:hypothetical protein